MNNLPGCSEFLPSGDIGGVYCVAPIVTPSSPGNNASQLTFGFSANNIPTNGSCAGNVRIDMFTGPGVPDSGATLDVSCTAANDFATCFNAETLIGFEKEDGVIGVWGTRGGYSAVGSCTPMSTEQYNKMKSLPASELPENLADVKFPENLAERTCAFNDNNKFAIVCNQMSQDYGDKVPKSGVSTWKVEQYSVNDCVFNINQSYYVPSTEDRGYDSWSCLGNQDDSFVCTRSSSGFGGWMNMSAPNKDSTTTLSQNFVWGDNWANVGLATGSCKWVNEEDYNAAISNPDSVMKDKDLSDAGKSACSDEIYDSEGYTCKLPPIDFYAKNKWGNASYPDIATTKYKQTTRLGCLALFETSTSVNDSEFKPDGIVACNSAAEDTTMCMGHNNTRYFIPSEANPTSVWIAYQNAVPETAEFTGIGRCYGNSNQTNM